MNARVRAGVTLAVAAVVFAIHAIIIAYVTIATIDTKWDVHGAHPLWIFACVVDLPSSLLSSAIVDSLPTRHSLLIDGAVFSVLGGLQWGLLASLLTLLVLRLFAKR